MFTPPHLKRPLCSEEETCGGDKESRLGKGVDQTLWDELRTIKRYQYDLEDIDARLYRMLSSGKEYDYAIHKEDTYIGECVFDLIVLRGICPFDVLGDTALSTFTTQLSQSCEARLRHDWRFQDLLAHMYSMSGVYHQPSSLWAHRQFVTGALRPGLVFAPPLAPGNMAAYLMLDAPATGAKLYTPSNPKFEHSLRPGDIIFSSGDDLELLYPEQGVSVCYLTTLQLPVCLSARHQLILQDDHPCETSSPLPAAQQEITPLERLPIHPSQQPASPAPRLSPQPITTEQLLATVALWMAPEVEEV